MGGRQTKRQRRQDTIRQVRDTWTDQEYGIRLDAGIRGGVTLTWRAGSDPSIAVMGTVQMHRLLDELEREWVLELREHLVSWDDIGWMLGITGEAARRRHRDADRQVDEGADDGQA